MRYVLRRIMLGLGAMLLVAGIGVVLVGQQILHVIVSFGIEEEKARNGAFAAFGGGIFLAAVGAGLLAAAAPGHRPRGVK
ncbi:MAG: hypothetical protein SFY69_01585 [Planctomycetota bacterium]|nr:hypothetical protein [Planctomycetota bacterium]